VEYTRHLAANRIHRLWHCGGVLDVVDAWHRSDGDGWSRHPIGWRGTRRTNPSNLGADRQIIACEEALRAVALGHARPDLLCIDCVGDGAIEALELSSARTPTLNKVAVEQMAAIDLLVLTRSSAYAVVGLRAPPPSHILVCGLETGRLYDVTPSRDRARDILRGIDAYLKDIEARGCAWDEDDVTLGRALATPSPDACGRCAYHGDCAYA